MEGGMEKGENKLEKRAYELDKRSMDALGKVREDRAAGETPDTQQFKTLERKIRAAQGKIVSKEKQQQ